MAVDDLWHLTKPPKDARPCGEHGRLIASGRHGRGKRYRVRYTDPAGQPKEKLYDRKVDADAFDVKVRADVARGEYVDPRLGRITFDELAEQWRGNQVHADTTVAQIGSHFPRHVYPYFGRRPVAAIKPSDVQGLVRHMQARLAPATIEVIYRYVVSVFKSAVLDGIIPKSPCVAIKRPEIERKRVEPLLLDVVGSIRETLPPRLGALADLGGLAGLRQGEAFGVEVEHIDFFRRTIRVEQQLKQLGGGAPFLAPPKTAKSRRTIPVGKVFIERLAAHLKEFPAVEVTIIDKTGREPAERMARLIVTSGAGLPLRRNRFSEAVWLPLVSKLTQICEGAHKRRESRPCGFCVFAGAEHPTFHDLRHWYASALIAGGASVTQVQHRLGHSTAQETLNTYSHLWPDEDDRTRDVIDALFIPAQRDSGRDGPRLAVVP